MRQKKKYSIYDVELYVIIQALHHWRSCLIQRKFILNTDHEALKYVNSQAKLNKKHASWISFLQEYTFMLRLQNERLNKITDALSRMIFLLNTVIVQLEGVGFIREWYAKDPDFKEIYQKCKEGRYEDYLLHDDFLFKKTCLCIPRYSFREYVIKELHCGRLGGHLNKDKTLLLVKEKYFWPNLYRYVAQFVKRCRICQTYKGQNQNSGAYMLLPIPNAPGEDISMNFMVGLSKTQKIWILFLQWLFDFPK